MAARTMEMMRASSFAFHASRMASIGRSEEDASPEEYETCHIQFVSSNRRNFVTSKRDLRSYNLSVQSQSSDPRGGCGAKILRCANE